MSRLDADKKARLANWLQENRGASHVARLEITKEELADLDHDVLLHLAAMSFVSLDGFMELAQKEPDRLENLMALGKSLGDQLEEKTRLKCALMQTEAGKQYRAPARVDAQKMSTTG
ncbi:hypothetical protein ACFQGA_11505 [Marinobacter koreensis]|uniref:hypothetical protein n=1 Tax=Marinobacter koreensis TaxID=335974 RepID=UPI00360ED1C8